MNSITLFDIRLALAAASLKEDAYEMWLTGKGYVIQFSTYLDSHLFAIGMTHALGSPTRALEAYQDFNVRRNLDGGGVTVLLRGSIVGC